MSSLLLQSKSLAPHLEAGEGVDELLGQVLILILILFACSGTSSDA
ncbi:MAG: hypothetical protein GX256_02705 [Fretibacterium sp.]|nr:hypothetical protein [Fretibacterium sp.]